MLIVRIEHEDGNGIFRPRYDQQGNRQRCSGSDLKGMEELDERHAQFNPPYRDGKEGGSLPMREDHFCAFKSIEQVQQWITKSEMKILLQNEYRVFLLNVTECIEGKMQVLFRKEDIISKKDISELWETD